MKALSEESDAASFIRLVTGDHSAWLCLLATAATTTLENLLGLSWVEVESKVLVLHTRGRHALESHVKIREEAKRYDSTYAEYLGSRRYFMRRTMHLSTKGLVDLSMQVYKRVQGAHVNPTDCRDASLDRVLKKAGIE